MMGLRTGGDGGLDGAQSDSGEVEMGGWVGGGLHA